MSARTDEPLDTLVFRPLAARLVDVLVRTPITPNQVSLAGAAAGIGAALCLARGGPVSAFGAPLLLAVSLILDVADGQLARALDRRTHAGWVMDILADGLKGVAVFIGLAVVLAREHGRPGLLWGLAAAVSVLVQVLARDHSLHRFDRELGASPESEMARRTRIDEERRRLREGPPTLARLAMGAFDLAEGIATTLFGPPAPPPALRCVGLDERERRIQAQGVWRHLGGTAQLVTVGFGAATGLLLPAAATLVAVGNLVLATATVFEVGAPFRARRGTPS